MLLWRVLNWDILAKQVLKFYWASYRGSLMYGFEKSKPVTHFTWWRPGHSTEATKAWFNGKRMYKVVTSKWNRLADVLEKRYLHKNVWKLVTICSGLRQITLQIWVQNDHFDEVQVRVSDWFKNLNKHSCTYVTVHDCFHSLVYPVPFSSKLVFKTNHQHFDSCNYNITTHVKITFYCWDI